MSRIYVETSIASFYFEVRDDAEMVARRNWTRRWFDAALDGTEHIVTSLAVIAELERGEFPGKHEALELFSRLPVEDVTDEVLEIAEAYIAHKVMPNDPAGDALHLAIASYHKCDFLVTWNCKLLANANKFGHIRRWYTAQVL